MRVGDYQQQAHSTAVYPEETLNLTAGQVYVLMSLGGESGELLNLTKKALRGDFGDNPSLNATFMEKLEGELGGILWYVAETCSAFGLSLEGVADENLRKLADRAERGVIKGSGDDR